jgi:hypothetical protein
MPLAEARSSTGAVVDSRSQWILLVWLTHSVLPRASREQAVTGRRSSCEVPYLMSAKGLLRVGRVMNASALGLRKMQRNCVATCGGSLGTTGYQFDTKAP